MKKLTPKEKIIVGVAVAIINTVIFYPVVKTYIILGSM